MLPPVGQMPVADDEQPAPRLKPYGSDSSLKPVTSDCPPRAPCSFLNCRCFEPAPRPVPAYWLPLTSLSQWVLCSRVNRRESALPDAHRQLIFAGCCLTCYLRLRRHA